MFRTQLSAIYDVLDRFTGGLKGHEIKFWSNLLEKYETTERMFGGTIEARILTLREQNKDDIDKVISLVLSHIKVSSKAKLVLTILNHIKTKGISVSNAESPLNKVLQDLASLEAKSSTSVSLKAQEVLIMGQMPSYEERLGQMKTVLRSFTSQYYGEQVNTVHTPSAEVLRELSDSRYTVFDILSAFFEHEDHMVPLAAFEVYIRRAYKAYTLLSTDYEEGDELDDGDSPSIVTWRFNLGQSHSPPSTPCISLSGSASVSDLTYLISRHQSQPIRVGAISSFPNFLALAKGFSKVASALPLFDAIEYNSRYGHPQFLPNVLNVALRLFREEDGIPIGWIFTMRTPEFPQGRRVYARELGLPRIHLSANSGARIGLAEELIPLFSAAWNEEGHPEKGVHYLYLTHENYLKLEEQGHDSIKTIDVEVAGELRHKITDIIVRRRMAKFWPVSNEK
ncbi:acetyl carboxylase [Lentinula edodes]|uniref:Acetyl carboxylase n=1 Tax=Lentinula edodes TaxID=5353 RepID=A0A1Q3EN13_LENED|nr:acetyl carboxylase [Lentinula edodes]